jgi:hypothetical protein
MLENIDELDPDPCGCLDIMSSPPPKPLMRFEAATAEVATGI